MKTQNNATLVTMLFALATILIITSCTSNWPQFRGPEANNVATSVNLPEKWANDTNVVWTYEITGLGNSSPIVWGDKVFFTAAYSATDKEPREMGAPPASPALPQGQQAPPQGQATPGQPTPPPAPSQAQPQTAAGSVSPQTVSTPPPPPPAAGQAPGNRPPEDLSYLEETYTWEVTCLDLKSGRELWRKIAFQGKPRIKKHAINTYANETPVTDGNRVYVYFGMTGLVSFDFNGNKIWEKDLGAFETQNGWGTGSSPVLHKDKLFVKVDNDTASFLVALDAASGNEVWKVMRDEKTTYSTPIIWKNSIRTELVTTGKTARSYDPETGELLWELRLEGESSIPSPVADKEFIYLGNTSGREKPGYFFAVKAGGEGDITPAEGETTSSHVVWKVENPGLGNPSPLLYEGRIYLVNSRGGEVNCLSAATGENIFKQKAEQTGACWATPWVGNGKIFFYDERGNTHILKAGDVFEEVGRNKLDDKFWASPAITKESYIFRGARKIFCVKKTGSSN